MAVCVGAGRATPPNPLAGGSASSIHTFPLPPPGPPQTRGKSQGWRGGGGVSRVNESGVQIWGEFIMQMSQRKDWGARARRLHSSRLTVVKAPASTYLRPDPGRPAAPNTEAHAAAPLRSRELVPAPPPRAAGCSRRCCGPFKSGPPRPASPTRGGPGSRPGRGSRRPAQSSPAWPSRGARPSARAPHPEPRRSRLQPRPAPGPTSPCPGAGAPVAP